MFKKMTRQGYITMKRITALILALALALSLAACKGKTAEKRASTDSDLTSEEMERLVAEMEKEEAEKNK